MRSNERELEGASIFSFPHVPPRPAPPGFNEGLGGQPALEGVSVERKLGFSNPRAFLSTPLAEPDSVHIPSQGFGDLDSESLPV